VWADLPIILITANHFGDETGCGYILDPASEVLAVGRARADRTFRAEFMHADAALLWGVPRGGWGWTTRTIQSFRRRFKLVADLPDGVSVWTVRTIADQSRSGSFSAVSG
jgi:hypothetical protein